MKVGDKIKYKRHHIHYKYLGDKKPKQGFEIIEAEYIGTTKEFPEYYFSEIVVKEKKTGQLVGIDRNQIIKEVNNAPMG